MLFSRIQNLHISQTLTQSSRFSIKFSRIQNLHISQTEARVLFGLTTFSRIQNLHISQTLIFYLDNIQSLVEFKIYISLKPQIEIWRKNFEFRYKKMDRHRSSPEGNLDKIFI